jgi:hypothetical protein
MLTTQWHAKSNRHSGILIPEHKYSSSNTRILFRFRNQLAESCLIKPYRVPRAYSSHSGDTADVPMSTSGVGAYAGASETRYR